MVLKGLLKALVQLRNQFYIHSQDSYENKYMVSVSLVTLRVSQKKPNKYNVCWRTDTRFDALGQRYEETKI